MNDAPPRIVWFHGGLAVLKDVLWWRKPRYVYRYITAGMA